MIEFITINLFHVGAGTMFTVVIYNLFWRAKGLLSLDKDEREYIYNKIVMHWGFFLAYSIAAGAMVLGLYIN